MKRIMIYSVLLLACACEPKHGTRVVEDAGAQHATATEKASKYHEIKVKDVIQADNYTYLNATENGRDIWLAIPKKEVEKGKTYYYEQAMEMKDFHSKNLNRTFETIYFLNGIFDSPQPAALPGNNVPEDENHAGKKDSEKQDITIEKEKGVTSIGYLYDHRQEFAGKKIKVKGLVTKFNPQIMKKNWVHLQDGTGGEKSFDLAVTTQDDAHIGEIATFEGVIALDKDFTHGYKYDIIMEEAVRLDKKKNIKVN